MEFMSSPPGASFAYQAANERERKALLALREHLNNTASTDARLVEKIEKFACTYGGANNSSDRGLLRYLRAGDVNCDIHLAVTRLKNTVEFRTQLGLDEITSISEAMQQHPLHDVWPIAFPLVAPDGCPVQYSRLGAVKPSQLTKHGEDAMKLATTLSLARAVELQAEVEKTQHCPGTYDVYDCSGLGWDHMQMSDLRVCSRCVSLGTTHFPETLYKCYVINAPKWITMFWGLIRPLLNDRTRKKISISSGVPDALRQALGGEDKLQEMLSSVPAVLRSSESN